MRFLRAMELGTVAMVTTFGLVAAPAYGASNTLVRPARAVTAIGGGVTTIDDQSDFASILSSNPRVVLELCVSFSGTCQSVKAVYRNDSLAFENINFYYADADNIQDLVAQYNVETYATFLFFKDGKLVDTQVGGNDVTLQTKLAALAL